MLLRIKKTKKTIEVAEGTIFSEESFEIVTKEQLEKEEARKNAAKAIGSKKTITTPAEKDNSPKALKKASTQKKKK